MKELKISIPQFSFAYLVLYGLFARYVEKLYIWNSILLGIFLLNCYYAIKGRKQRNYITVYIFFTLSLLIILISNFMGESSKFFFSNFKIVFFSMAIAITVLQTASSKNYRSIIKKYAKFFNLMWIVNLCVLAIQCTGSGFMIKEHWLEQNRFYKDQCCGLFGNSGTHELGLFAAFILILNLYRISSEVSTLRKQKIMLFLLITEALHFVLSTMNDNVAAFIVVPMFFVLCVLMVEQWKNRSLSRLISSYGRILLLVTILLIAILQIPIIKEFVNNTLVDRFDKVFHYNSHVVSGGNERLSIFFFAVANNWSWMLGRGFGSWGLNTGGYLGYAHFGLSNIGSFTVLGGIWLYIIHLLFVSCVAERLCIRNQGKSYVIFVCVGVFVVLSIYSVVFSSPVLMLWCCLIFSVLGIMRGQYLGEEGHGNG